MAKKNNTVSVEVETAVYPLEAVYAAANTFSGKALVRIGTLKKGYLSVVLSEKPDGSLPPALEGLFFNELLHHALRLKISARHQGLREKVITQALLSAQPSAPGKRSALPAAEKLADAKLEKEIEKLLKEAEAGGYKSDPLGIAVPWESKRGRKSKK